MSRPFYCGSQAADWQSRNCFHCQKMRLDDDGFMDRSDCEIDAAILTGYFGDGTIPDDIARRMGYTESPDEYTWDCPEKVARLAGDGG